MSWLYSRALVEAYSEDISSDGEPSAPSSETPTPLAYCAPDRMTAFSRLSRFGTTLEPLTEGRGKAVLMSFLEDFRAKTSAPPDAEQASLESGAASGEKWRALSVRFDRNSRSWKIAQCLFGEVLQWSSVTLPRWGMMRDGACWERITSELPTGEIGFGSWPTPRAADGKGATTATDLTAHRVRSGQANLAEAIVESLRMFPTPTAHNAKEGAFPAEHARNTPTLACHAGGKLNPTWVEWLMGWPLGWTALEPLGTDKYQAWLRSHGACSADPNAPKH